MFARRVPTGGLAKSFFSQIILWSPSIVFALFALDYVRYTPPPPSQTQTQAYPHSAMCYSRGIDTNTAISCVYLSHTSFRSAERFSFGLCPREKFLLYIVRNSREDICCIPPKDDPYEIPGRPSVSAPVLSSNLVAIPIHLPYRFVRHGASLRSPLAFVDAQRHMNKKRLIICSYDQYNRTQQVDGDMAAPETVGIRYSENTVNLSPALLELRLFITYCTARC